MKSSIWLATLFTASLLGCSQDRAATEVHEASFTGQNRSVVTEQKNDYQEVAENQLRVMEKQLGAWKSQAREASESTKDKRYELTEKLQKQLDEAKAKLSKMSLASATEYKEAKKDLESAIKDLNGEFESAASSFN